MRSTDSSETDPVEAGRTVSGWLRVLRDDHPDAEIVTELVRLDPELVVMRAELVIPGGGRASGYGAVSGGSPVAIETAESRALLRALNAMGYGEAQEHPPVIAPDPLTRPARTVSPAPQPVSAATPVDDAEPAGHAPGNDAVPQPRTAERTPARAVDTEPVTHDPDADPPLEDYSWTAFWNWARGLGYQNKIEVEKVLDQSITSLSPAEVRDLLRTKTPAR